MSDDNGSLLEMQQLSNEGSLLEDGERSLLGDDAEDITVQCLKSKEKTLKCCFALILVYVITGLITCLYFFYKSFSWTNQSKIG